MNTKEFCKKYWFLLAVGCIMLVFLIAYAFNMPGSNEKNDVTAKQVDGKYAIYSIDGEYYFADELYDTLYNMQVSNYGLTRGELQFINSYICAVANEKIPTDTNISNAATNYAYYILQSNDTAQIESMLKSYGYNSIDDLNTYIIDMMKESQMINTYLLDHYDELVSPVVQDSNARLVSHILVTVADIESSQDEDGNTVYTAHMSDDEQKKLDDVLAMLKTDSFENTAIKYSDDGSAAQGGSLGVIDNTIAQNYVPEFSNAALKLSIGETSEPVLSQYGYHIITVKEATKEDLLADSSFMNEIYTTYPNIELYIADSYGKELGYEIKDEALNTKCAELVAEFEASVAQEGSEE